MFDAILDPDFKDIAQSLMLSLLFLLNNPDSKTYIRPQLDLQILVYIIFNIKLIKIQYYH